MRFPHQDVREEIAEESAEVTSFVRTLKVLSTKKKGKVVMNETLLLKAKTYQIPRSR